MTEFSRTETSSETDINERAAKVAADLERIAEELFVLMRCADEATSMRLDRAVSSVTRAGQTFNRAQNIEYGND